MPNSPYGSPAYLIGAGLSSLPQVMAQNADMKTNAAMKKLQLEELQRQADTGTDIDKAYSDPMTMPTQTVTSVNDNPEFLRQQAVDQKQAAANQASVSEFGDEGQGQQAPEFSTKPTAPEKLTKTEQLPHDYKMMPHLRHAHEAEIVADRLRALGRGRAAQAIEDEGLKHQELHKQQALSGMAQAILGGQPEQAKKWANSMGMNLAKIEQVDPDDDSETALFEVDSVQPDGSIKQGYATKKDLVSMSDPKLAIQSMNQMQALQGRYQGQAEIQKLRNEQSGKNAQIAFDRTVKAAQIRADAMAKRYGAQGDTAKIRDHKYLTTLLSGSMGVDEASKIAGDRIFGGKNQQATQAQLLAGVQKALKEQPATVVFGGGTQEQQDYYKWLQEQEKTHLGKNKSEAPAQPKKASGGTPAPVGYKDPKSGLTKQEDGTWAKVD